MDGGGTAAGQIEALRRELSRRDEAQELAGAGSWVIDLATGVCTWSRQLHVIFGTDPGTLDPGPDTYLDYVLPEDRPALERAAAAFFAGMDRTETEFRIRRPDGGGRTLLLRVRRQSHAPVVVGVCMDVTDLRRAEQERQESLDALAAATEETIEQGLALMEAQELAGVGSWSLDLVTGRSQWSPQMYRICGWPDDVAPPEQAEYLARVHPDDLDGLREHLEQQIAEGGLREREYRMLHPDGGVRRVLSRTRAHHSPAGTTVRYSGIMVDVTEERRRQTEAAEATEALRGAHREIVDREEMLEEAQLLAGLGSFRFEPASGRLWWSEQMHRIFGTDTVEGFELTLERYQALIHPDDIAHLDQVVAEAVVTGESYEVEHRLVLADGQERILQARGRAEYDADGTLLRLTGTGLDVTDARRTERELTGARDLFQQLLSAATDQAIIAVDTTGDVTLFNKGAEELLGYTRAEMLGRKPWTLLRSPEELAELAREADVDEVYLSAFRGESERGRGRAVMPGAERDRPWRRKDGSVVTVQMTINPMKDADGVVVGYLAIATDVTEQRRAERERDEHAEQLNVAMAETSRARDEALAANAAKSSFLATMSHEIRTPMNAVIGMTGLLLDTDLDADQRDLLGVVRSSGDQLLALINDILDFSKVEAGELDLEHRPFALRELVEGTMALFATADHGLDLVTDVDPGCPATVVGDVTRVRQVLVNLVGNAIKFTSDGDVLLRVRPDGDRLRFEVTDTGIGIPAGSTHRLFDSFSQVDASTTRVYGGTGLGLAISRALVHAMGGEIWVDSALGEGSTFAFTVALGTGDADAPVRGTDPRLAGRRVLLVDDNRTSRDVLAAALTARGMAVAVAVGGHEALRMLETQAFDVALLDRHMPGLDGVGLARAIRVRSELPLVLLAPAGRRAERDPHLFAVSVTKPVRAAALDDALLKAVAPAAKVPAPARPVDAPEAAAGAMRPLSVLLAEDNEVNQKVARLILTKLGHDVTIAPNGAEALAAVHATRYDVVLMDMHMPVMDGLEATRRIRAEVPDGPRIVAMTASVTLEDRQACIEAGMDGYLPKPVRSTELAAALDAIRAEQVPTG